MQEPDVLFKVVFSGESAQLVQGANVSVSAYDVRARHIELAHGPVQVVEKGHHAIVKWKPDFQKLGQSLIEEKDVFLDIHFRSPRAELKTTIDKARRISDLLKTVS